LSLLALTLGLALSACGDDSARDAGVDAPADASRADTGRRDTGTRDAGRHGATTLRYTPEGCDYEVSASDVDATARGEDVFGAESTPDHVHLSWASASESSFAVNWHTGNGTLASGLVYGTGHDAAASADAAAADVTLRNGHYLVIPPGALGGGGQSTIHEVHVCGLTPDTTYYYKVGGPGHWSRVFDTATAPAKGSRAPFSFALSGDSRNNEENAWPIGQHHVLDRGVDFEVFTGDAVFLGSYQPDWDNFFSLTDGDFNVEDLFASTPLMVVNGNHENLAVNYFAQFAFPDEVSAGEEAQGEEWYSFDYANAHFIMLNDTVISDRTISDEATWLRTDLEAAKADPDIDWIFASHHRPVYTCGSTHGPAGDLRDAWQPLLDEFEVDMVLNGHNHMYHRSRPIRGLSGTEGVLAAETSDHAPVITAGVPSGTVYVISGGAGAPLYGAASDCAFTAKAMSLRTYSIIEIDGRSLSLSTYSTMSDALVDSVAWTK
ncbi:MAG: hypothetical protein GXP55_23815, partial [Deltaproteobacteria bacterium]|nr:hypothetical protein [Deltaproteobacteria bacterium]